MRPGNFHNQKKVPRRAVPGNSATIRSSTMENTKKTGINETHIVAEYFGNRDLATIQIEKIMEAKNEFARIGSNLKLELNETTERFVQYERSEAYLTAILHFRSMLQSAGVETQTP
jgi:hypothetical protein